MIKIYNEDRYEDINPLGTSYLVLLKNNFSCPVSGFYCFHASSEKLTFLWKFHHLEKCDNPNTNKNIITNLTAK